MSVALGPDHDDDEGVQVASNRGWVDFLDWVDSLPDGSAALRRLCDEGHQDDIATTIEQLGAALKTNPPSADDVRSTAQGLASALEQFADAKSVVIS